MRWLPDYQIVFDHRFNIIPQVESGDWWKHVKGHYVNSKKLDMIFMKYEDMHMDGITGETLFWETFSKTKVIYKSTRNLVLYLYQVDY